MQQIRWSKLLCGMYGFLAKFVYITIEHPLIINKMFYWFFMISFGTFSFFFIQNNMPYFTLPFTLPTMVFINVNDTRGLLHRIEHYSFPEKQTYDWYKSKRVCIIYQFLKLWYRKPRKNVVDLKHWPYTVAYAIDCVCSKMLNHGFFLSLFKLIQNYFFTDTVWILEDFA